MKKILFFILLMCFVLPHHYIYAATEADTEIKIDLPASTKVTKTGDVSSNMLNMLFGEIWTEFAGEPDSKQFVDAPTPPIFKGLIASILGILNTCALIFVSGSILYMWGIFAVTTAHEGKKLGGGMYNSLWVPIRHTLAFTLTIPVFKGASILQVVIMTMVSLSINFANIVWDASGKYIVEHANTGIINSYNNNFAKEAYDMSAYIFQDLVIQEMMFYKNIVSNEGDLTNPEINKDWFVIAESGTKEPNQGAMPESDITSGLTGDTSLSEYDNNVKIITEIRDKNNKINDNGLYTVQKVLDVKDKTKKVTIGLRSPKGLVFYKLDISKPSEEKTNKIANESTEMKASVIKLQETLQNAKIAEYIKMAENLRPYAQLYLKNGNIGDDVKGVRFPGHTLLPDNIKILPNNQKDLSEITTEYTASLTKQFNDKAETIMKDSNNAKDLLTKAIDSENGESKLGWVSAGMFTFSLASYQRVIIDVLNADMIVDTEGTDGAVKGFWARFNDPNDSIWDDFSVSFTDDEKKAIKQAKKTFSDHFFLNSQYKLEDDIASQNETFSLKKLNAKLGSFFLEGHGERVNTNNGFLPVILDRIGKYDPLVVLSYYGSNLLNVSLMIMAGTTVTPTSLSLGLALFFIAIMLAFVAPMIPFIFWLRAILSWLFLVVETLIAAPFWACTHAMPEGEGFAGRHAKLGYTMLLDILIRPVLLVLGAVFSIAIIQAIGWLFNVLLNYWFATVGVNFIGIGTVPDFIFSILLLGLLFYVSFFVFTKGINFLPERIIKWIGGHGNTLNEDNDTNSIVGVIKSTNSQAGSLANQAGHEIRSLRGKNPFNKNQNQDPNNPNSIGQGNKTKPDNQGANNGQIANLDDAQQNN